MATPKVFAMEATDTDLALMCPESFSPEQLETSCGNQKRALHQRLQRLEDGLAEILREEIREYGIIKYCKDNLVLIKESEAVNGSFGPSSFKITLEQILSKTEELMMASNDRLMALGEQKRSLLEEQRRLSQKLQELM